MPFGVPFLVSLLYFCYCLRFPHRRHTSKKQNSLRSLLPSSKWAKFTIQFKTHYRPCMCYIFGKPWVQGPLWQCSGVSDMQIHKYKYKYKDKYTWAQYNSDECRTHSWTRSSSEASGSLRPFGPVSRSNVACGSNVGT